MEDFKEHAFDGSFFAAGHVAGYARNATPEGAHARNVTIQTAPLHRCLTIAAPETRVVRERAHLLTLSGLLN